MEFTPEEYSTLTNSRFLLVKADVIKKVAVEFDTLQALYKKEVDKAGIVLPLLAHPKISRGENYKGLPYLVLDYPAVFQKEDILAFRTLFWWGNFFSITLHLQGAYKQQYVTGIETYLLENKPTGLFISCGNTPWEYHYDNDNYKAVELLTNAEISTLLHNPGFVKISAKIDLQDHLRLQSFMQDTFTALVAMLKT